MKVRLFERHSRGLKLTEAGAALFPTVERVYLELIAAHVTLTEKRDRAEGNLTIITERAFGSFWLIPYLEEFRQRHPSIHLSLISDDHASTNHVLQEGVYVQLSSYEAREGTGLISHHLCSYRRYFFAGKSYVSKRGAPTNVDEIDGHSLIGYGKSAYRPEEERAVNVLLYAGRPTHKPRRCDFLVEDVHSNLVAMQNNLGLTATTLYLARTIPEAVEIDIQGVESEYLTFVSKYIIYPEYLKEFERVRVFKEFVEEKAALLQANERM
jgi:DNA-binding transcriptional LysR family regulator